MGGEIVIKTSIDTSGASKGASELSSMLKDIGKEADSTGKEISGSLSAEDLVKALGDVSSQMQEFFKQLSEESKADYWTTLTEYILNFVNEIKQGLSEKAPKIKEFLSDFISGFGDGLKNTLGNSGGGIASFFSKISAGKKAFDVVSGAFNVFKKGLSGLKNIASRVGRAVISAFKKMATKVASSIKSIVSKVTGMGKKILNLAKSVIGISSLLSMFNKLKSVVKETFQQLAKQDATTNKNISELTSSLKQLKDAFGVAFEPIINTVIPYITQMVQSVSGLVNKLSILNNTLVGNTSAKQATYVYKDYADSLNATASAASNASKYLTGLDEVRKPSSDSDNNINYSTVDIDPTDAVAEFAQKLKDMFEAGDFFGIGKFLSESLADALTNLNGKWPEIQEKAKKLGTNIADLIGGAASDVGNSDITDVFESLGTTIAGGLDTIGAALNGFLTEMDSLDAWTNIGTGIQEFFTNLFTIDWDTAKENITLGIQGISDALTGFFGDGQWIVDIASNIGDVGGTLVHAITNALTGANWNQVGTTIAQCLSKIPFADIGTMIGELVNSIAEIMTGLLSDDTFVMNIVDGINNMIAAIDPSKLADVLVLLIDAIGDVLVGIDWGTLSTDITTIVIDVLSRADLLTIIWGLIKSVLETFAGLFVGWIQGNLEAYIKEEAEKLKVAPQELIDYYVKKIEEWTEKVDKFNENVNTTVVTFLTNLGSNISQWFTNTVQKIKDWFEAVITGVAQFFLKIITNIKSSISQMRNGLTELGSDIRKIVENIKTNVTTTITNLWNSVSQWFTNVANNIRAWGTARITAVVQFFIKIIGNIRSSISQMKTGIIELGTDIRTIVENMKTNIVNIWTNLKTNTTNVFTNMKTSIVNIFNGLKDAIKTPINTIIGFINSMLSGITGGINGVIENLNGLKVTVPAWATKLTGVSSLGFNIAKLTVPSVPYLATGAVIPPNKEFMAVLGDQKSGNNIEAPEDLIRQIVREESGSKGNTYTVSATANRKVLFELVIDEAKARQLQTGKNPFDFAY